VPRAADAPDLSSAQAPGVPGSPDEWIHISNVDGGRYEKRYGEPMMMSACTMADELVIPQQRSIRTFGRFDGGHARGGSRPPESEPGSTATKRIPLCDTPGQTGPLRNTNLGAPCQRLQFWICCEDQASKCVSGSPVPELTNALEGAAESLRAQRVTVVGAYDEGAFLVWDIQVMADFTKTRDTPATGLRAIVAGAGKNEGQVVLVRGQFRGRNLFGDLPAESRRGRDHWVLADQGVALWVTGKGPKGEGFALDLDQPSASARWLEVEGTLTARDGVVYLKARRVALTAAPKP
jgi:hypothetical protein